MDTGLSVTDNKSEWIKARYSSVTSTDLGKIMGVDQQTSRKRLLWSKLTKTDLLENCSRVTRDLVTMGQTFEKSAREAFVTKWELSGGDLEEKKGFVPTMHTHPVYDWFTGSPDYLIPERRIVVEFKTHFFPNAQEAHPILEARSIPLKYYLQVQGYMEIMDYDDGILVSWTIAQGMTMYWIRRDKRLWIDQILPEIKVFRAWMQYFKMEDLEKDRSLGIFKRGEKVILEDAIIKSMVENTVPWEPK